MEESERLRELLIDLERAREQECELRLEAEALLEGLRVLTLSENMEAMFAGLIAVFRPVLSFQDAFVLATQRDGTLRSVAASLPLFADRLWRPQALFERVLKGQPAAVFDVSQVAEWREQPEPVHNAVGSALHIPLCGGQWSAMLVCTHPERGFFGQKQMRLVRRFAPLASQVLLNVDLQAAMARRGRLLQTAAEVSQVVGSILDEEKLIQEAVNLIRDRFDLYYVGLFLVDDKREWAVLRAGTGQAGESMLQAGYRLAVGGESMIGRCLATGQACITLDAGAEVVRFDNPLLPLTRSEMALPLFSRGRLIGAMTIQSTQPAAFSDEDVSILQTMADQLANAVENARLFEQTRDVLARTGLLYQVGQLITAAQSIDEVLAAVLEYARHLDPDRCLIALLDDPDAAPADRQVEVKAVWDRAGREGSFLGNRFTPAHIPVIGTLGPGDRLVVEDFATGEGVDERTRATFLYLGVGAAAIVPLAVGGRLLGWLLVETIGRPCVFAGQEVDALQAIAGQAAVALQNLRRLEEIQARAEQEQAARAALAVRIRELGCLSDIGRKIDEAPPVPEFLAWVAGRIPAAMQYPDLCRAAIEFGGQLYGAAEATRLPRQMVQQMRIGGKAVGRVYVAYTEDHDFLDEESALLGDITRRVSGYIENRRLIQEAQTRAEELAVLNDLARTLAARLDVDQVLQETFRGVSRLVDTANFYIGLYDPEKHEILFRLNITESEVDRQIVSISADQGLSGYIVRHRTSVLIKEDVLGWHAERGMPAVGEPAASWLGVPLLIGDQVLGVMAVQSYTTPGAYDEHDRDMLTAIASQAAIALQNARLFEEARVRAEELTVLNEMSRTLTGLLDADRVLENLYHYLSRLMDTTNLYVALYDPRDNMVSFPLAVEHGRRVRWSPRRSGQGLTEYIIRTGEPVLIEEGVGTWLEQHGVQAIGQLALSWLGVPLKIGERVLGVIAVQSYETPRLFGGRQRDLLSAFASQAAIAIENARLFEEIQLYAEEQATLRRIIETISSSLEVRDILQAVLGEVLATLNFDAGLISLSDETTGQLYLAVQQGLPEAVARQLEQGGLAGTLCEAVSVGGEVINIADLRQGAPVDVSRLIEHELYAYAGIPLVYMGKHLGSFSLFNRTVRSLTGRELAFLTAVGRQIGIGVENARLFAETNRHAAQLQSLYVTSLRLSTQLSTTELLHLIVEQAVNLLQADAGGFYLYEPQSDELVFSIGIGYFAEFIGNRLKPGEGLAGQVFENRRPLAVEDYQAWIGRAALYEGESRLGAVLGVPLLGREGVLGVLDISGGQRKRIFGEEDIWLAELFATQAAIALENARLFEQTRDVLARTGSLYQVSQLITAAQSIEEVLAAVLEYARHLDPDRCLIALLDDPEAAPADRQVEVKAIWDRAGREASFLGNRFTPAHIPVIGTLGPGDRLVVEDFATSDRVDERTRATFRYLGVGAAAIVPLAVGNRLLGWLLVETVGRPCVFAGQEVDALQAIAGQAAVALQNLRRLEEIQARAEREQAARAALAVRIRELGCLSDIGRKIDEAPPVPEFLAWVAGRIPAAMQYPDLCRAAIELEGAVYGDATALKLPNQMVQSLVISGERLGRICIAYTQELDFLDEESALLGDITRRVGGYIENRRLIQEAQTRAAQERRLRAITDRIRRGTSIEAILHTGLEELGQVLGASQCIVRLGSPEQLLTGQPAPRPEAGYSLSPAGVGQRSDGSHRQGKKGGMPQHTED